MAGDQIALEVIIITENITKTKILSKNLYRMELK